MQPNVEQGMVEIFFRLRSRRPRIVHLGPFPASNPSDTGQHPEVDFADGPDHDPPANDD